MTGRAALLTAILLAAGFAGPEAVRAQWVQSVVPAKDCTGKTAMPAAPGDVAADPAAYAGKCVKLGGWWRDIAFYPTRSEAAVVDALSIRLLDNRRVGLYLPKKHLDAAPRGPKLATVIGTVGICSRLGGPEVLMVTGYCHYKGGAYLAVAKIEIAK